jgi:sugar O-acyltransferase (sialic acid O-acetyltransferase NeuD family)
LKDLIIVGAGGFGREVAWLIEDINKENNEWNLLGFIDENIAIQGSIINGYRVLGGLEYLNKNSNIYYVCAIGNSNKRKKIVDKLSKVHMNLSTLIHPSVIISKNSDIGEGSILCASCIISVNVRVGRCVIINWDCTIGHDAVLENFVTLYPSVNISGNCNIDKCVEIGTGAQIIQGKNIGENSIIGAGSVVVRDIDKNKTAVGVPAKIIK